MNNIEKMFKEMYDYLQETKNVMGNWNLGGASKRDNLIIIARFYNIYTDDEQLLLDFKKYIEENNLEKLKF